MSIQAQDKKALLTLVLFLIFWFSLGFTLPGYDISDIAIGSLAASVLLTMMYLLRRKSSYLSSLVQKYIKQEGRVDLNMIAVQVAYGRYKLALVTFKLELQKKPENKTLQEIVSLMEDLKSENSFFT